MVELKDYAIGTLTFILLISLGINIQPDDTHLCRDLEITMKCDRLSSTDKTCYPTESTNIGKKYCSSTWEEILKEDIDLTPSHGNYICTYEGCNKIK